jgi:N-acetylated-alpha-linked acidic dipeptidase
VWFQITDHQLILLGYGATTLPGITEAISMDGDALAAGREVERLKIHIDNLTERISL